MTCQAHERRIGDYIDGTLAAADRAAVEAHLAACAPCRALAADLESVQAMARALEPLAPPPHVWTRIAASAERAPQRWWRLPASIVGWQPVAAMAMAALLTTGLWWVGDRLMPLSPRSTIAVASAGDPGGALIAPAHQAAEQQYTLAIAQLEEITTAEQSALDADTADVLQAGLTVIDDAIVESRAALETEPESEVAQESLFQALRHKVDLLQMTLALINEMRKANPDAAARIVSESNE
jgi:hypothetical protein